VRKRAATSGRPSHPLVGTWGPLNEGESNIHFTVTTSGGRLRVAAGDIYDGEKLKVSAVSSNSRSVRFTTRTPSTGMTIGHELRAVSAGKARYSYTISQIWQRLSANDAE
jgi:hypothetical protein